MKKKYIPYIICYAIILALLLLQHSVVSMYYDDFGNASLSYAKTVEDVIGTNFTLAQVLEEAKYTYFNFGGRVLYGIIITLLLKKGITLFMTIQSFIILGILIILHRIIKHITKVDSFLIPAGLFVLYSIIHVTILRHGNYWASASILYIWPLLPLFGFIYLYISTMDKVKNNKKFNYWIFLIINFVLLFFSNFSQEQIGVLQMSFLGIYILFDHIKEEKKYLKYDIPIFIFSIVSYLLFFLAPGNWKRMGSDEKFSNLSLPMKMARNVPRIFDLLFKVRVSDFVNIICALLVIAVIYYYFKDKKKNNKKYYLLIFPILGVVLNFVMYFGKIYNNRIVLCLFGAIVLLSIFVLLLVFHVKNKSVKLLAFPISAICSVFCLLIAPYTVERQIIPCIFVIFIMILFLTIELLKLNNKIVKVAVVILWCVLSVYGTYNYIYVFRGYYINKKTNDENYNKLDNYEDNITDTNVLKLCKVKDSTFGSTQSYEQNYDYWLQQYFDIPYGVTFEWNDCE